MRLLLILSLPAAALAFFVPAGGLNGAASRSVEPDQDQSVVEARVCALRCGQPSLRRA